MKSITEFKEAFLRDFPSYLPERFEGSELSTQTISKNGRDMTGVIVKVGQVSPVFYIEQLYEDYQNGMAYEDLLDRVAHSLDNMVPPQVDEVVAKLKDWKENARVLALPVDHPKVSNFSAAVVVGDIAAVPYIKVSSDDHGFGSVTYDDTLCQFVGVEPKDLIQAAIKNMSKDVEAKTLRETMLALVPPEMASFLPPPSEFDQQCVVITNTDKIKGAGIIFSQEAMDEVCRSNPNLKDGCYILPSSTEEVIALSFGMGDDPARLQQMVAEVNANEVEESQKLSDNVYAYYPGIGLEPVDPGRMR